MPSPASAAPRALLLAALVALATASLPAAEAASPIYALSTKSTALVPTSEFHLGEPLVIDLHVRTYDTGVTVYHYLRLNQIAPVAAPIGTISDGGSTYVPPNTATTIRLYWDQYPSGSTEPVGPGRYQIAYLDGSGKVVASTLVDLGYMADLTVPSLTVQSAPAPAPVTPMVPHVPQPVTKRITACIVNSGPEAVAGTDVSFYFRATGEDPAARHLIRATRASFDGTQPPCPGMGGTPSALLAFDWTLPADVVNGSLRADQVVAIADPSGTVLEVSELNNARVTSFAGYDPCEFTWALCPTPTPPTTLPTPPLPYPTGLPWPFPPTVPPSNQWIAETVLYVVHLLLP